MDAKIPMAVDGSATTRQALWRTIELAGTSSAKLRIVLVVDAHGLVIASEIAIDADKRRAARLGSGVSVLADASETARMAGTEPGTALIEG